MKYYFITNKEDDYGNCRCAVYYGKENDIKKYVYHYEEIPTTHYNVLKKYHEDLNEGYYEDFSYSALKEYLSEYYS